MSLSKSLLIEQLAAKRNNLALRDVESSVRIILDAMADALAEGRRVEVRRFGSFSLHYHKSRTGRNPKSGEPVDLPGKYVLHFKPGKELRERVNASLGEVPLQS